MIPMVYQSHLNYKKGSQQYGRTSWNKDPLSLLGEIKQETVDIVGWAPFMWMALARLQEQLVKLSQLTIPEQH